MAAREEMLASGSGVRTSATETSEGPPPGRKFVFLLPLLLFAGLATALGWGLTRNSEQLPSNLIGRPVPEFNLPPVKGRTLGLSSEHLKGEVSIVNFFASWCAPCRAEHPLFMQLAREGVVPLYGINYKDRPDDAARWLNALGDPYTRTGADLDGRVGIDWGVYGMPETFVVDRDGRIAHKHIGLITEKDMNETIVPLIRQLQGRPEGESAKAAPLESSSGAERATSGKPAPAHPAQDRNGSS